jgi:cell division topological specificity factor
MSLLSFFLGEKKKTATVAKERLQIILAHERSSLSGKKRPDYLPDLQRELMAVISKYVSINPEDIKVHLERQDDLEVLDIKIELPESMTTPVR